MQGVNYILPLIVVPYIVRIVGPEKYGEIAFSLAVITLFSVLTDYGFNYTATKAIAENRDSRKNISEIFSVVLFVKGVLLILSILLIFVLTEFVSIFIQSKNIIFITTIFLMAQTFFPVWFFQGMERMSYISLVTIAIKILYVVGVFLCVHHEQDFTLVPLINGLSFSCGTVASLVLAYLQFDVKFSWPSIALIKKTVLDGRFIFLSNISTTTYTAATTILLGFFCSKYDVGLYAAAEKLIKAVQGMLQPVFRSTFPYVANMASSSREATIKFIRKLFYFVFLFTFTTSFLVFWFSESLVKLVFGEGFESAVPVLRILAFLPLFGSLNNVFGIQTLLVFNRKEIHLRIISFSSLLYLFIGFLMVPKYCAIGSAISLMAVEILIPLLMIFYLQKSDIKLFFRKI